MTDFNKHYKMTEWWLMFYIRNKRFGYWLKFDFLYYLTYAFIDFLAGTW